MCRGRCERRRRRLEVRKNEGAETRLSTRTFICLLKLLHVPMGGEGKERSLTSCESEITHVFELRDYLLVLRTSCSLVILACVK